MPPAETEFGIEDIRGAMLGLMTAVEEAQFPHVMRRVRYAGDVQGLWFPAGGDLMAALASSSRRSRRPRKARNPERDVRGPAAWRIAVAAQPLERDIPRLRRPGLRVQAVLVP